MNLSKIALKNIRYYKSESALYILSSMISIMVIYTYLAILDWASQMDIRENVLGLCIFSMIVVFLVAIFFMTSTIRNYIQVRGDDYRLLSLLGVRKIDFLRIIVLEYGVIILKTIFFGLCMGTLLMFVLQIALYRTGMLTERYPVIQIKFYLISVLFLLIAFIISTIASVRSSKPKMNYKVIGMKHKHILPVGHLKNIAVVIFKFLFLLTGIFLEGLTVHLILNGRELLKYVAVAVNIVGIFFILFSIDVIIPILRKTHRIFYLKHIIGIQNFSENLKRNKTFMYSLFLINFLILYFCGLMIVSFISVSSEYQGMFPYDLVVMGGKQNLVADTLENSDIEIKEEITLSYKDAGYYNQNVKIMSSKDIAKIYPFNIRLHDNECIFMAQRIEEKFSPVNEEEILNVTIGGKETALVSKDAIYHSVYGCFEGGSEDIIVVSEHFFQRLKENRKQVSLFQLESNKLIGKKEKEDTMNSLGTYLIETGASIYDRDLMIGKEKLGSFLNVSIVGLAGFLIMIEGAFVMHVQLYKEVKNQRKKYNTLKILGMEHHKVKKLLKKEYNECIRLPILFSLLTALFISCSYITLDVKGGKYLSSIYIVFTVSCYVIEEGYFYLLKRRVAKEVLK